MQVYNFCVAVDDAMMEVTHVLRAEEHLPNTLRQMLIYEALGYAPPQFGHMSLILAPDKSKLSKRHGATSVGEFRQQVPQLLRLLFSVAFSLFGFLPDVTSVELSFVLISWCSECISFRVVRHGYRNHST